ncbi:hypothetical protein Bca52824_040938 [Brassica carinata]|uniref:Uncharacterized protein n=1 Tax=Brassica carinata TaxID=52824 RepID=A0A8X7UXD9_BRACI|nr:hypothetical protein Bca52824_040938 [Brassica carinata]
MFGGGLSAADLARKRPEKKHKDKEAKDKKERDSHVDSPVGDSGDVYEPTHIANLVGRTSIITHLGNSIPNTSSVKETIGVDPKPAGDCTFTGPPLQPTNISRGVGQKAIPTEPSDAQASDSPQQVKPAFVQPQVDKVINMMISEIEGLTELEEVVPPDDTTNLPLCREADEDHDRNIEDAANTQMDIESSSPLGGQNNSTHNNYLQ